VQTCALSILGNCVGDVLDESGGGIKPVAAVDDHRERCRGGDGFVIVDDAFVVGLGIVGGEGENSLCAGGVGGFGQIGGDVRIEADGGEYGDFVLDCLDSGSHDLLMLGGSEGIEFAGAAGRDDGAEGM